MLRKGISDEHLLSLWDSFAKFVLVHTRNRASKSVLSNQESLGNKVSYWPHTNSNREMCSKITKPIYSRSKEAERQLQQQ